MTEKEEEDEDEVQPSNEETKQNEKEDGNEDEKDDDDVEGEAEGEGTSEASSASVNSLIGKMIIELFSSTKRNPAKELDKRSLKHFLRAYECSNSIDFMKNVTQRARLYGEAVHTADEDLKNIMQIGKDLMSNVAIHGEVEAANNSYQKKKHRAIFVESFNRQMAEHFAELEEIKERWTELDSSESADAVQVFKDIDALKNDILAIAAAKDSLIDRAEQFSNAQSAQNLVESEFRTKSFSAYSDRIQQILINQQEAHDIHLDLIEDALNEERKKFYRLEFRRFRVHIAKIVKHLVRIQDLVLAQQTVMSDSLKSLSADLSISAINIFNRIQTSKEKLQRDCFTWKNKMAKANEVNEYVYEMLPYQLTDAEHIFAAIRFRTSEKMLRVSQLRVKMVEKKKDYEMREKKFKGVLNALHRRLTNLHELRNSDIRNNQETFAKIWTLYYKDITTAVEKFAVINKAITEQVLCIKSEQPEIKPIAFAYNFQTKKKKKTKALPTTVNVYEVRFLRNTLRKIATSSICNDMTNASLKTILERYPDHVQDYIHLSDFINLLQITDAEDLKVLAKYFVTTTEDIERDLLHPEAKLKTHLLYAALRHFLERFGEEPETKNEKLDLPSIKEIRQICNQFYAFFPDKMDRSLKLLVHAMKDFYVALARRKYLTERCERLRRMNLELKHLLKEYN